MARANEEKLRLARQHDSKNFFPFRHRAGCLRPRAPPTQLIFVSFHVKKIMVYISRNLQDLLSDERRNWTFFEVAILTFLFDYVVKVSGRPMVPFPFLKIVAKDSTINFVRSGIV